MKALADMTSQELANYIEKLERVHRHRMKSLRALMRAMEAEEIAERQGTSTTEE